VKLSAAMEARRDPNFLIIARTDAIYLLHDVEEGIARLNAYTDAGADLVMAPGLDPSMLKSARHRIKGKLVITDTPGFSREEEARTGVDIVLYYGVTLYATPHSIQVLQARVSSGSQRKSRYRISRRRARRHQPIVAESGGGSA
jgi:methylisocitrate lyase